MTSILTEQPMQEQPPMMPTNTKDMFVLSSDSLRGEKTDQKIPDGWNERPPLFDVSRDEAQQLKDMTRKGIPPALRCAVWLSSIVQSSHPHQPEEYSAEYRTLAKVRLLDNTYDTVLKQVFSDASEETTDPPLFGMTHDEFQKILLDNVPEKGQRALTRVLCAAEHTLGIDNCVLLPTICTLLLNCMSESYAFCAVREMAHNSSRFFPVSRREHYGWCRAFGDILKRLHPQTAKTMEDHGALTVDGLDPIFKFMFIPILRYEHVLRIMDIYTYEGSKVLFRFGVALLCLCKKDLKEVYHPQRDWWERVKQYTHSEQFQFDYLVRKAYGYHGSRYRRRIRFPRRHIIHRIIRIEEERAELSDDATAVKPRPLGLLQSQVPVVLAKPATIRTSLAEWLPFSLRLTKMDLVFSTNTHGRTLERFYEHVHLCRNTITLMEVLNNGAVIGMYASQAWHSSPRIYGDGECFLFRASPSPKAWKWRPDAAPQDLDAEHQALQEQFMVGRDNYLSMGANEDGTCGIRINEDLTRGESAPAQGYGNEPLPGDNLGIFDIGLVEVYSLDRTT